MRGDIQEIKHNYVRDKLVVRSEEADKILSDFASCCTRKEGGGLLLKLSSADEKQNMMKHLTETYDIDEVKVFEPSLNDIFVEYTKDRNEEAGE